jgi:sugar phosphate isomerase/epimerase
MNYKYSVFTKPWKIQLPEELASLVSDMGFDGVEFPLRGGYQVQPSDAVLSLPALADVFAAHGLKIYSVASGLDEHIFEACAISGVPMIRIMAGYGAEGYLEGERRTKAILDGVTPLCEKYSVKVGVQHHCGKMVNNSMELRHLLEGLDKRYIGAVWDAAHSALAGENPEQGLEILREYLFMVNFKAAYYRRTDDSVRPYFTAGRENPFPWADAVNYLKNTGYDGVICMPAEYTDESGIKEKVTEDLIYLKNLFGGNK